uniref:Uncharacterized protein n=1 Tax=viral metagenome TaxID=1070528 RepID=A0A6M3LDU0_9ZZZZ
MRWKEKKLKVKIQRNPPHRIPGSMDFPPGAQNKPFGIELTAETEEEETILNRFWYGGIKQNALCNSGQRLQLTFKDLIGKHSPVHSSVLIKGSPPLKATANLSL